MRHNLPKPPAHVLQLMCRRPTEHPGLPEIYRPVSPWLASVSGIKYPCFRSKQGVNRRLVQVEIVNCGINPVHFKNIHPFYYMFIFFTCIKKMNQKKVQPITWSDSVGLPCAACKKRATSESRSAPPSRLSALCSAARLREMALFFGVPFCAAEHRSC